jgi:hypothetical protein
MKKILSILIIVLFVCGISFSFPQQAAACSGTTLSNGACQIFLTSGTTWSVPSDWNNASNTIEALGPGADGTSAGGGANGGGGGGYSKSSNVTLTAGGTVDINVGTNSTGQNTWLCNTTTGCASIAGANVVVGANAG